MVALSPFLGKELLKEKKKTVLLGKELLKEKKKQFYVSVPKNYAISVFLLSLIFFWNTWHLHLVGDDVMMMLVVMLVVMMMMIMTIGVTRDRDHTCSW